MRRTLLTAVLVALALAAHTIDAAGQTTFVPLDQLTDASALVVTGRAVSVFSQWDPAVNGIYTYARFDVSEVWKGDLQTKQIVIKLLGGRVGDIELAINGQARLETGKEVALWLEVRPRDRTLFPAGLAQGVRELTDATVVDTLRAIVRNRPSDTPTESFQAVPTEWQPDLVSSFTVGPPDGGPARWHEADNDARVYVDYEMPVGFGGGVAQIDAAIVLWNTSGMRLRMERGNERAARCLATYENGGDGRITLSFSDPCGEVADNSPTFGLGGGYFTAGDLRTVSGVEFKKFLQGAAMLNPVANAPALQQRGCFQDAIAHNLGHTIGLGDSNVTTGSPLPLMSNTFGSRCSATPSTLAQDDRDGARAIYPAPPSAPLNLSGSASGTTVTLSWTAPTQGTVTTYVVEAGSVPGQPTISMATGSTTTGAIFNNVPQGFYYIRVRARNNAGTGPPSNEIGIAVACSPPQPPANLAFTAVASNVTFTWTPPASGPAPTSYLLAVGSTPNGSNLLSYQFAPTTSLGATGPPGTYYVRLHTLGACGVSAPSNEVSVTLPAPCVTPSAPQNFAHTVGANRLVSLSWAVPASGTGPFTYTIEVGSAPGLSNLLVMSLGGVTSVSTPAPPGTYHVRIRATNACGTAGTPSIERTVVVP